AEIEHGKMHRDRSEQHPEAVVGDPEMREVERQHHETDDGLGDDRQIPRRNVAGDGDDLSFAPRRPGAFAVAAHAAPLPKRTTLTVSNTIVRSKNTERCLM